MLCVVCLAGRGLCRGQMGHRWCCLAAARSPAPEACQSLEACPADWAHRLVHGRWTGTPARTGIVRTHKGTVTDRLRSQALGRDSCRTNRRPVRWAYESLGAALEVPRAASSGAADLPSASSFQLAHTRCSSACTSQSLKQQQLHQVRVQRGACSCPQRCGNSYARSLSRQAHWRAHSLRSRGWKACQPRPQC